MAQLTALTDSATRLREAQDRAAQIHHRWERLLWVLVADQAVDPCLKLAAARWSMCDRRDPRADRNG